MRYDIEANPPTYDEINADCLSRVLRSCLFFLPSLSLIWHVAPLLGLPLLLHAFTIIGMLCIFALMAHGWYWRRADNVISAQLWSELTDLCKEVPQIDTYVKKVNLLKRGITMEEYAGIQAYHRDVLENKKTLDRA